MIHIIYLLDGNYTKLFFRVAFQKFFKEHPFPELLEYSPIASEEEGSDSSNENDSKKTCFVSELKSKFQPSQPVNSNFNFPKAVKKMMPNKNFSSASYDDDIEDKFKAKCIAEKNLDELEKEKMMIESELEEINSKQKS